MDTSGENSQQGSGTKKGPFEDMDREELINKCKALLTIAQRAKIAKSELQNEVESYKLQLEKAETEKKSNVENVKTLQELVDSLTEQKLNFITEVDSAQSKVKALNNKCVNYEEEIKHFKADIIVKDKNISVLNQKISDFDIEITSLKRQNNRLVEENEQLISQLAEFEARAAEFNNIGLQQREQLKILEENTKSGERYEKEIEELRNLNKELESKLKHNINFEEKINELTEICEAEKAKKDKAYIKLRSYKDKILKCAACITQLKNSRFILSKTVKEYSENIPKWQDDIIKASKALDIQMNDLNNENIALKAQVVKLEQIIETSKHSLNNNMEVSTLQDEIKSSKSLISDLQEQLSNKNIDYNRLTTELHELKLKYEDISECQLTNQIEDNKIMKEQLNDYIQKCNYLTSKNDELNQCLDKVTKENKNLLTTFQNSNSNNEELDKLTFQIKALESEKATLLREKLNAKDSVIELENQNKNISEELTKTKLDLKTSQTQIESLLQEKSKLSMDLKEEKETEINLLKCELMTIQEQYNLLKKQHENLQDLNGLLKEEVDTLKLSLEQPKDDADNVSELNESLQTDIVKLETKLAAYKQENASLLAEIKDSRNKSKEYDNLLTEYEEAKSKLASYKSENAELLHEMKEINQVLKERGEAISKLQKAITEMERLVETLEKDRDNMCQEKADQIKKIQTLESDLKNAEQVNNERNTVAENAISEIDTLKKNISVKDATILALKDEIEKLKQHQLSSAELPNEDMSTSTISKAEEHARMKDLDETFEEKYTKLRIFALKLKKKLNETTNQLQQTEQDKARLEKMFNESKSPLATRDEIDNSNPPSVEISNTVSELQGKIESLTADLELNKNSSAEIQKIKEDLAVKTRELSAEIEAHKATKENLEKARRDVKKKNVLSLEMEDYERSMKDLSTKMEESKKKMVQMESTIDTQEGTITAMKTQIKLLEEQIKSEEKQNRLTKEELQHAIEDGKEKDNVIQAKIGLISKLEQDLEDEKTKNEEADLEMTTVLSEKEKVIMSLGEDKAELNNKVKKLEFKCAELNEKLRITNIELADLKTEYTSYKVRAQAVLRQNQTVDHSQEEQLKEEAAALRAQLETLTAKLNTAQEEISEKTTEAETARRRLAEATNDTARAQQRTARLQSDLTRLSQQLESERTQHKLQVSTLTQCYKTQIGDLESKLQKETEILKQQLKVLEESVKVGTSGIKPIDEPNRNQYMLPIIPKDDSDGEMDINVSMIPREEGEGSESAPSPPPSKPYLSGSGRSPVPLERLLEEGVPDDEALDTMSLGLTPEQEIADLKRRLTSQQQRVKHVTVLLSESERECARMAQLSELLKAELRRVRGTTANAHNTEYMKNVTLKFLTLPPGDERGRLVPVLQKILTLTHDETQKIQAVAKGLDPNPSKSWGSYLPWPGGK